MYECSDVKQNKNDLQIYCFFSEENKSFSDTIKLAFKDYLKENLPPNG